MPRPILSPMCLESTEWFTAMICSTSSGVLFFSQILNETLQKPK